MCESQLGTLFPLARLALEYAMRALISVRSRSSTYSCHRDRVVGEEPSLRYFDAFFHDCLPIRPNPVLSKCAIGMKTWSPVIFPSRLQQKWCLCCHMMPPSMVL